MNYPIFRARRIAYRGEARRRCERGQKSGLGVGSGGVGDVVVVVSIGRGCGCGSTMRRRATRREGGYGAGRLWGSSGRGGIDNQVVVGDNGVRITVKGLLLAVFGFCGFRGGRIGAEEGVGGRSTDHQTPRPSSPNVGGARCRGVRVGKDAGIGEYLR